MQNVVPLVYSLLEASRSDLATLIEEIAAEELALAVLVVPCLDFTLVRASGFDGPSGLVW